MALQTQKQTQKQTQVSSPLLSPLLVKQALLERQIPLPYEKRLCGDGEVDADADAGVVGGDP